MAQPAGLVAHHIVDHLAEDIVLAEHPGEGIDHPGSNNNEISNMFRYYNQSKRSTNIGRSWCVGVR